MQYVYLVLGVLLPLDDIVLDEAVFGQDFGDELQEGQELNHAQQGLVANTLIQSLKQRDNTFGVA